MKIRQPEIMLPFVFIRLILAQLSAPSEGARCGNVDFNISTDATTGNSSLGRELQEALAS
jgi:hypothetical protein